MGTYEATIRKGIYRSMHPALTIFCAFTRQWAVDIWLDNLADVEHDPTLTNLCIIIDGDQHLIANTIKKFAEAKRYRSFHMKINEDWHPNEVRLAVRRMRVADIHNQSKDLVAKTDGDIIIGLEDDTVFDRMESFAQLYAPLLADDKIGFVEGVQMGRWGANIIGAWQLEGTPPTTAMTLLPSEGLQRITGGGFYGYATSRSLYMNHEYYTSSAQPWGPDVNFGIWLVSQGYKCFINWDLVFGHNDYNKILYPDDAKIRLANLVFNKDEVTGKWNRSDYEQTRY